MRNKILIVIGSGVFLLMLLSNTLNVFNMMVTRLLAATGIDYILKHLIVPLQIAATMAVLQLFSIKAVASQAVISIVKSDGWHNFAIGWNCTGWQSLSIMLISFIVPLQFKCSARRKMAVFSAGIVWIFVINISRIVLEILILHRFNQSYAVFFHDYLATAYAFIMFGLFWVVAYLTMLKEEREAVYDEVTDE